jgi:hypothetical protein
MIDPNQRTLAQIAWVHSYRLAALIAQWSWWLCRATPEGHPDRALAISIGRGVRESVRCLCRLGLFDESEDQIMARFPDPRQVAGFPGWHQNDEDWGRLHRAYELVNALLPLQDRLMEWVRRLETAPEALVLFDMHPSGGQVESVSPAGTSYPPGTVGRAEQPLPAHATSGTCPTTLATPVEMPAPLDEGPRRGGGVDHGGVEAEKNPGPPGQKSRRFTRKGEANLRLRAALEYLISQGNWGKQSGEIIKFADISSSTFYHLIGKDGADGVKILLKEYKRLSRGRGPVRAGSV